MQANGPRAMSVNKVRYGIVREGFSPEEAGRFIRNLRGIPAELAGGIAAKARVPAARKYRRLRDAARIGFDRSILTWQWENPSGPGSLEVQARNADDAGSAKLVETGVGNEARLPELRREVLRS